MRRFAVLALTVGVVGPAGRAAADDVPRSQVVPAGTGWRLPDYGSSWRKIESQTASGPVMVPPLPDRASGPRVGSRVITASHAEPYDPLAGKPGPRVASGAPATPRPAAVVPVGHKEPVPLPVGYVPGATGGAAGCADGTCGGKTGSVWQRFTGWLCFRQTPVKLGLHPIPYPAPLYTYFPCQSGPGCGTPTGAAHGGAGPHCGGGLGDRLRGSLFGRPCTGSGCQAEVPGGGDPGLPGYRLASPLNPAVAGPPGPPPVSINSSSYRLPLRP